MIARRSMLLGLLATPAIVRASSLMRVVPIPDDMWIAAFQIDRSLDPLDQLRILGWKTYYSGMKQALPDWTSSDVTELYHGGAGRSAG